MKLTVSSISKGPAFDVSAASKKKKKRENTSYFSAKMLHNVGADP